MNHEFNNHEIHEKVLFPDEYHAIQGNEVWLPLGCFNNREKPEIHERVLFPDECVVSLKQRIRSGWRRNFLKEAFLSRHRG